MLCQCEPWRNQRSLGCLAQRRDRAGISMHRRETTHRKVLAGRKQHASAWKQLAAPCHASLSTKPNKCSASLPICFEGGRCLGCRAEYESARLLWLSPWLCANPLEQDNRRQGRVSPPSNLFVREQKTILAGPPVSSNKSAWVGVLHLPLI